MEEISAWIDTKPEGGYLLLLGPPGQGKSALMAELVNHVAENHENLVEGEFALTDFVDKFGPRLAHLNTMLAVLRPLAAAAETFRRLGATPWTTRADRELRAAGITVGPADTGLASLTPQQRQIAELAAAGQTNKEIAARLFLSPRTVSTHLYQVFPKLGITSRAALRDALAGHPGNET